MPNHLLTITPDVARRLAISRQRLAGPLVEQTPEGILDVLRDLRCLQLDPISAVARSHLLVLFSRLGPYQPAILDTILWDKKQLFEYWAHCASLVLTEDYPIHHALMRAYSNKLSSHSQQANAWLDENAILVKHILDELRDHGPLSTKAISDRTATSAWYSSGWTSGRTVNRIFDMLWFQGIIMVTTRRSGHRLWDLAERHLPDWTPRTVLDDRAVTLQATQHALRALGISRPAHIRQHFIRGRYNNLSDAITELVRDGSIQQVNISTEDGQELPGPWYIHQSDLPLLERLVAGEWEPRTTLLSPFDNLICDRARTNLLFDFDFRIEIYVPQAQRKYGYYVLPILHGDRLIGRIDPLFVRKEHRLAINAIYREPGAPKDAKTGRAVKKAIEQLATFLGAKSISYPDERPSGWKL
jgi:uncharacterized protein